MVSKIRRTPSKSVKSRRIKERQSQRKRTPIKNAAVAALASINRTLHTCQRRLTKIFCKLGRINTPNRYKILKKVQPREEQELEQLLQNSVVCKALSFNNGLLPPLLSPFKKTVFLDLDETLVHSKADPPPERFDFVVRPRIDGEMMNFYVLKRPGVDEFLESLAAKYEVVVFTAGLKEYASLVLDCLDRRGLISHRLYRDSCKELDGRYVKDLSEMGRDLNKVVIVDDNPNSYVFQPLNAIPVKPFVDDVEDLELSKLVQFFDGCDCFDDVRDAVQLYLDEERKVSKIVLLA